MDPSIFGGVITVQAEDPVSNVQNGWTDETHQTYNITSESDMLAISEFCNEGVAEYLEANYVLYKDLDFTGETYRNRINIGSSENHFKGTFDGQGHTIEGLWGDAQVALNNGLFGVMEDATVKNLIIKGADYRSNQYGGILAAQAKNSTIQNVTIIDSSCKVASLGAIVGLITTGGLYGGALVGYADNTKIYNCESRNTSVYVDTTGGVQALGGDGMYMGGLVGGMNNNSIIEYSRVVGGSVSTQYYMAVGALAANNIYAGGIVGWLNGSTKTQVIDCFSTANVNYSGECYVSVGAGITGYAGGIAARISGNQYAMERCQFAGNLSGHLLNSILVLPVIPMEDYYLGGIAGQVDELGGIKNCFFNWENAIVGNNYPGGPNVPAVWEKTTDGTVGVIGNAQYNDPDRFLEFDFEGTVDRNTGNETPFNDPHINKWVIDKNTNMPVHGRRVEASMDFSGAGTITFAETSIQPVQTTNTNEKNISQIAQVHADMNEALTLTATVNEGYNFKGWYKDGTLVAGTEENPDLTLILGGESSLQYEDNDLYEAKYTADVTFKGMNDGVDVIKEYIYNQDLDPEDATLSDDSYVFLGWSETEYAKEDLQSSTIPSIKFVGKDDSYSVTKPMTLYPVFISIKNYNVKVQMQSASLEAGSSYIKGNVGNEGNAEVKTDANGLFITVNENDNVKDSDKYRFDGWYEISEDNTEGTLVSRTKDFYLTNVDLNKEHRYEARYQYMVTAWIPREYGNARFEYGDSESKLGDYYIKYGEDINTSSSITKPSFDPGGDGRVGLTFVHWSKTGINPGTRYTPSDLNGFISTTPAILEVTEPMDIYAVVRASNPGLSLYYPVTTKIDFPAGVIELKITSTSPWLDNWITPGSIDAEITIKDGYNLKGIWQYYYDDGWYNPVEQLSVNLQHDEENKTSTGNFDTGYGPRNARDTRLVARLTADINFHKVGGDVTTVQRKYRSLLFCTDDTLIEDWDVRPHTYGPNYEDITGKVVGSGVTPSNDEMYRNGYKFIGWTTDEGIFTDKENYVVSSEAAVKQSLLNEETIVLETMEVYPVYLKYDITLKTNFDESASPPEGSIVESTVPGEEGSVIFTFTGDGYEFADPDEWTVTENGSEIDATIIKNDDGSYTIKGLDTETKYEIIADCTATVTFNNEDGSEVKKEQYDYNQELGKLPKPTQNINDKSSSIGIGESFDENVKVFVGWNTEKGSDYVTEETKVTAPMDLQADYKNPDFELKSDLEDAGVTATVSEKGDVTLDAPEKDGYEFTGWVQDEGTENEQLITTKPNVELTPEQLREHHTYTAKYNPVVTYKIPKIENGKFVEGETVIGSVPYGSVMGDVIDSTIVEVTNKIVEALKGTDYVFKNEWSKDSWNIENGQSVFKDPVTEPVTVYPIITVSIEEPVMIYSNIDDSNAEIMIPRKNAKLTFPEPEQLPENITKEGPRGVDGASVETQFVGYSLVFIINDEEGNEIKRVSDALYAPGDQIAVEDIIGYANTKNNESQIARIYAVWAQIQNISNASIYQNEDKSQIGLFTAAAVNTTILANAGLQSNGECNYERHILYSKDGKYIIATTNKTSWNNTLYQQYFDKNFVSDENWNIYVSFLYNISSPVDQYGVCPYLSFTYKNSTVGNFRDENNQTVEHTLKGVAQELLSLEEAEQEEYSWSTYKKIIEGYANYEEAN